MSRRLIALLVVLALVALGTLGCESATSGATRLGQQLGLINEQQKGSIDRTTQAFRKSFHDLTEQEEYSLGRAVAAQIIARYGLYHEPSLTAYVNRVGKAVVVVSSRPEIYGGYHFAVLDSDEPNAFSAPGGFIFVTRGLLRIVPNEDALAGVLAHEVGHVAEKHGLAAINKDRLMDAFGILGREAGRTMQKENLVKLTDLYEGAVGDILKTVVEKGYGRSQEREADEDAVKFASAIGYQPKALLDFLTRLESTAKPGAPRLLSTHAPAAERKAWLEPIVSSLPAGTDPAPREQRFRLAMAKL